MPKPVRIAAGLSILGVAALLSGGCADNDSGLFVRSVIKLSAPQCTANADPSATMLGGGVLDLEFRDSYSASLLVGNQLVPRASADQLRTETSRIVLRGAEVEVNGDSGSLGSFTVPGTGFVDPSNGASPGYGVFGATLVPPGLAVSPGQRLVVEVRVFGDTLGGDEITSDALQFPVNVCRGCLISYPADADDPSQGGYQCVASSEGSPDAPCRFGQDDLVDCRLCTGSSDLCRTPASAP